MDKKTQPLTPENWLDAGFRALCVGGLNALKIEPIARELGASRGSFYWHFSDLLAFKLAMLDHWKHLATDGIIDALSAIPAGKSRLTALMELVSEPATAQGGYAAEPAIRDWARFFEPATEAVKQVDSRRLAYLAESLAVMGVTDANAASLLYAAHLGAEQSASFGGGSGFEERMLALELLETLAKS